MATAAAVEAAYQPTPRTREFEAMYQRTPRLSVLGRGSFGVTFPVRPRHDSGIRYAAKEIPVAHFSDEQRRAALSESDILRTLSHKNVVACIDTFLTGSSLYIIMECATKGDLSRHVQNHRDMEDLFAEATVMAVFAQVCAALRYIHGCKIMHRDLKPANLFVFGDTSSDLCYCEVKLGDFGLGKVCEATTFEARSTVGSPSYFSPEICKNHPYGRKSDMWSLGVVLYELAALVVPFVAKVVPAVAYMICTAEPKPLPDLYSTDLTALVASLLRKDPTARPGASAVMKQPYVQQFTFTPVVNSTPTSPGSDSALSPALSPAQYRITRSCASGQVRAVGSASQGRTLNGSMSSPCMEKVWDVFKDHDAAGSGKISVARLSHVFLEMNPNLTCDSVSKVLAASKCNRDGGTVDYEAFLEWLDQ